MATKTMMTVEQFAQLATTDPEDYELVEGELIPLPSGTPRHGIIRGKLERFVGSYLDGNRIGKAIGEIDCQLSSNTVRRPDVAIFLGKARLAQIDWDRIPIPFAPDIAVEVLSPNERAMDVRRKVRDYLRAGTKEVWLLDHANGEVAIHTNGGIRLLQSADALESEQLPGFTAAVADLVVNI